MSEESLNTELNRVARALGGLRPAASRIDRDRLFFLAGQAAMETAPTSRARSTHWLWPLTTVAVAMMSTLVTLKVDRSLRSAESMVADRDTEFAPRDRTREAPRPSPVPTFEEARGAEAIERSVDFEAPHGYLAMRRRITATRWSTLPISPEPPSATPPDTAGSSRYRDLLPKYLSTL
jgi:hypothetical protein